MKVAVSGAGYVVPFHLRAWKAYGADVVAICDPDLERAHARADAFGIANAYPSLEAMLGSEQFDALDIAAPREVHVEQSLTGLAAGLPVLCQKPVAVNVAEAERLLAALGSGSRLMVHENWRFRPHYRRMAAWRDEGRIGPLRHATIAMRTRALLPDANGVRPALERQPFFATEKRMLVAEVMIHHLDTARRLCGELTLRSAQLQRTQDDLPGETYAGVMLEAAGGAPVIVSGDMTAPGTPPGATDTVEICGSKGRMTYADGSVALYTVDGASETLSVAGEHLLQSSFDAAIAHFAEQTRRGGGYETDLADNIRTLRLVEEVYNVASARTSGTRQLWPT